MKKLYPLPPESEYGHDGTKLRVEDLGGDPRLISVGAIYPDYDNVPVVEFDQESVRASGGIRVTFDYKRNGYVVTQQPEPPDHLWPDDGDVPWLEVGFFPAFWEMSEEEYRKRVMGQPEPPVALGGEA